MIAYKFSFPPRKLRETAVLKPSLETSSHTSIPTKSKTLQFRDYSRLSLDGRLHKTDTSVKRTLRVGHCLSLLLLFDSL